jgi:type VI secretion system protein ImpA
MTVDAETLLKPISADEPCGPDLSYDEVRQRLESEFEESFAGSDQQGKDWKVIADEILKQFDRTKDVWWAVYLCRAAANARQLERVELGAAALAGLLERYWNDVHPKISDVGPGARRGPCESLTRPRQFLTPLTKIPLVSHTRLGEFTGADFQRLRVAGDSDPEYPRLRAILDQAGDAPIVAAFETVSRIEGALRRADAALLTQGGIEESVDFKPAYAVIAQVKDALSMFLATPVASASAPDAAGGETAEVARRPGAPQSREDVVRALDSISEYYRTKEPGSPIPMLMERAKAWTSMTFMQVLADIAPQGLDEAKKVLEKKEPKK